ncbi:unnamed protein product, partial [marine sediment metagenome]
MSNSYISNEETPASDEQTEDSVGTEVEESVIPDRFQDKSMDEIIESYTNLEKEHSRQGNELGENRKLVDKLLQAESRTQEVDKEEADWDYEPEKAAKSLVESEVGTIKTELNQLKSETALRDFKAQYPDFEKDSMSSDFKEWVAGSPYRIGLYNKNTGRFDSASASELMSGWEDRKEILNQAKPTDEKREKDLKAASMERGGSSGGSRK